MAQSQTPAKRKENWSSHPTFRFLVATSLIFGLYWGWGYVTGPSKISPALWAVLEKNPSEVDITGTTVFPPEEFHISIYQQLGSMRGVRNSTAALFSMSVSDMKTLSRYYWVDSIDAIPKKK